MLNKTETDTKAAGGARSLLSADIVLTGDLKSQGTIEVQGRVDGDITATTLIIGAEGQVNGAVRAETIEVKGKLDGKASCVSFTLRSASHVRAEVNYETLVIESGATIDGRFSHAKT